ncbi:MAG: hypothetical protein QOD68_3293 [Actinomycetota bacterium]|jgi:hypothetical protein|nr:hypothetical protein [Actinomycetota bacterium]
MAAWGSAALAGAVSPDQAADEVRGSHDAGHRVLGLPDEDGAVNLAYALARLRALGVTGLRLVLPRPGDATGLPGPPAFNERAIGRGEAVLTVGGRALGLLGETRGTWSAHPVAPDSRTPVPLAEASRALTAMMRDAAAVLARLDVARWEPAAADVLAARSRSVRPALPLSVDPGAHTVLEQALRVASIVELARAGEGAAVSADQMAARSQVLRDLDVAARRAVEAACSPPVT